MIVLLIVFFSILTYIGLVVIKPLVTRIIVGGLALILLLGSVGILTLHMADNYGTKEVTTTSQSSAVYTAGDLSAAYGMIIKSEIGQNTGNYVFVFRTSATEKTAQVQFKPTTTTILDVVDAVKKSTDYQLTSRQKPVIITKTVRRIFSSTLTKLLFEWGGQANQLVSQHVTLEVPEKTWLVLTQAQIEKLQKLAPQMQKEQEAALKANPQEALAMEKMKTQDPQAYAALQVTQIKKVLGIN
ncbi:MAG: DUF4811 domain-containing protein [Lactococcus sp.]